MSEEGKKLVCGVDEAGRGPVIGPLILAGVAVSEDKISQLEKLGVRDSKLLTPKRREHLFKKIIKLADAYHIIEVSPREIDGRNAVGTNLNRLEAIKAAKIINEIKPDKVFVDSPEPADAQKFARVISYYLSIENKPEIVAEHRADSRYKIVSAASVLAKVTRDRAVKEIQKICRHDFGSGYPSDPICQKFIKTGDLKQIDEHIRKCWVTYQLQKERKEQKKLGDF